MAEETAKDAKVAIRFGGATYRVRGSLTVLAALRKIGFPELKGCGCRLGDCGECLIPVMRDGDTQPRYELCCIEKVEADIKILDLPFPWVRRFRLRRGAE